MKPRHWSLLAVAVGGMIVFGAHATASEQTSSKTILVRSTVTYADPAEQKQFREALVAASIAHEVSIGADGNEYVSWSGDQDAAVEIVMVRLFGETLLTGRHIHFGGQYGDQFKAWLTANGIPFRIVSKRGKEYVVWEDQAQGWRSGRNSLQAIGPILNCSKNEDLHSMRIRNGDLSPVRPNPALNAGWLIR